MRHASMIGVRTLRSADSQKKAKPLLLSVLTALTGLFAPCTILAAERTCVEISKVCADSDDRVINGVTVHRECWRWRKTYRCRAESPEAGRCEAKALPSDCAAGTTVCTALAEDGTCLAERTDLVCGSEPSGPGILPDEPVVTVKYSSTLDGILPSDPDPEGCTVTKKTCLDDAPRTIPVSNWPGHTATASPACWAMRYEVSCPTASESGACRRLEEAGCTAEGEPVCEEADASDVCHRWSAVYRCPGFGVTGDDIVVDDTIEHPTGSVIEDTTECEAKIDEARREGMQCETVSKTCEKPGETVEGVELPCALWSVTLSCRAEGKNGCKALEQLAASGVCTVESPTVCEAENPDGTCRIERATFKCGEAVNPDEPPEDAELIDRGEASKAEPVDECADLKAEASCVETENVCVEGPGTHMVDDKPVYKDCWTWKKTYVCPAAGEDECRALASDPACTLVSSDCPGEDADCDRPMRTYSCRRPGGETVVGEACDGEACIAGVCVPTDDPADEDFAGAMVGLEIGRQAGVYGDITGNRFFQGEVRRCKDRVGAPSCCREEVVPGTSNSAAFGIWLTFGVKAGWETVKYLGSPYVYDILAYSDSTSSLLSALYGDAANGLYSPSFSYWGVTVAYSAESGFSFGFSPAGFIAAALMHFYEIYRSCDAEDQRTALARGQRLCKYVGPVCTKKAGGKCLTTEERYVCFNSRLARILNEQGRPQIGRGWGTPDAPDPRGFTIEEMNRLDFSKMNLNEFVRDVIEAALGDLDPDEAELVDIEAVSERAKERVNDMLEGIIADTAAVPGATGKTRSPNEAPASFRREILARPAGLDPQLKEILRRWRDHVAARDREARERSFMKREHFNPYRPYGLEGLQPW